MSNLAALLFRTLAADTTLAASLARFAGQPAIFSRYRPLERDPRWDAPIHYPRIVYDILRVSDPARQISGTVTVDIEVPDNATSLPDDLADRVESDLDGMALHPDNLPPVLLRRGDRTQGRDELDSGPAGMFVRYLSLHFDLSAFPNAITGLTPDIIQIVNDWTAANLPGVQVNPATWTPTGGTTAVYWWLETLRLASTPFGYGLRGILVGKVLAPDTATRQRTALQLATKMAATPRLVISASERLVWGAQSNLLFEVNPGADPFTTGQIRRESYWHANVPGQGIAPGPDDAAYIEFIFGRLTPESSPDPSLEGGAQQGTQTSEDDSYPFEVPDADFLWTLPAETFIEEASFVGMGQSEEDSVDAILVP